MKTFMQENAMMSCPASANYAEASSCCPSASAYNCMGMILGVMVMASIFVARISILSLRLLAVSIIILAVLVLVIADNNIIAHRE